MQNDRILSWVLSWVLTGASTGAFVSVAILLNGIMTTIELSLNS